MLQGIDFALDRLVWFGILTCSIVMTDTALGQELDPQQLEWTTKYRKQDNAPEPAEMLLNTDPEPELAAGFTPLFNGTDLTGWITKGGTCSFEVKEGLIVATCVPGSSSTYLCTQHSHYSDFVFTCELKWEVDCNSGIQFRSQSRPGGKFETVFGPQFEMEGQRKGDRNWSGGIYGQSCGGYFYPLWLKEHQAARAAENPVGWNRVTILARGDVVKTWLNGVPVAHWVGDGSYSSGLFGLQVHKGQEGTILFRSIRVRELDESDAPGGGEDAAVR